MEPADGPADTEWHVPRIAVDLQDGRESAAPRNRPVRKVLGAGRSGYLGFSPRRAYSPLKNLPFRSRPISANLVVDVLAASDTNAKPGSRADHSMVAEHSWYSPA